MALVARDLRNHLLPTLGAGLMGPQGLLSSAQFVLTICIFTSHKA